MGDSAYLMHGFSYTSTISNQSKQGNPMCIHGESISFGRFVSESEPSLSWEKWSTFSNKKKYVEEAASFAQPGSVAQKKAFFEAHYKKIAARKAAAEAEAAALLEQQNAARAEQERFAQEHADYEIKNASVDVLSCNEGSGERVSVSLSEDLGNRDTASCSEGYGTPLMERPLLKGSCDGSEETKKSGFSSLKSSIRRKTWRLPSTPVKPVTPHFKKENNVSQSLKKSSVESMEKKRPSPKSFRGFINSIPTTEPDKEPVSLTKKPASSGLPPSFSRTPKDCKTPIRTPLLAAAKGVAKYSASTPQSMNRRMKTSTDHPSESGSKTAAPKWNILSSVYTKSMTACRSKLQSPSSSSSPFVLRTEERAARRKQKLEEKFNTNEEEKVQLQKTLKEKAENEILKLSYCFKARPLPDFYKDRETSINQTNKTPDRTRTPLLRSSNSKKQGTVSVPPPSTPPKSISKSGASKNPSRKIAADPGKVFPSSLPRRITHENKSPNIQTLK